MRETGAGWRWGAPPQGVGVAAYNCDTVADLAFPEWVNDGPSSAADLEILFGGRYVCSVCGASVGRAELGAQIGFPFFVTQEV